MTLMTSLSRAAGPRLPPRHFCPSFKAGGMICFDGLAGSGSEDPEEASQPSIGACQSPYLCSHSGDNLSTKAREKVVIHA